MSPLLRVRMVSFALAMLGTLALVSPASAQFYEDARRALGLSPDPLDRSPGLVGMGSLSLVGNDLHNRIDLWEFTGNPAGMIDADSTSTLEFDPGTRSESDAHDLPGGARERQDFALRDAGVSYEALRRTSRETGFGLTGNYGTLRTDNPLTSDEEQRSKFAVPHNTGFLSGRLSFLWPERLRYGLRLQHRYESSDDDFLAIVKNGAGEFIDRDGRAVASPDVFTPDHLGVRALGVGAALALRLGAPLTFAGGFDHVANAIERRNDGDRSNSEIREDRPFEIAQAVVTGKIAGHLEYIAEGRSWTSSSSQRWVFTLSGGSGGLPLSGRGQYLDRTERGEALRSRLRWAAGRFEFGAGLNTSFRRINEVAPPVNDLSSFNYFLDYLFNKAGTDSLVLPDSVRSNQTGERAWNAGLGAAMKLPFRDGQMGLEYHRDRSELDQTIAGKGPTPAGWDVRAGADIELNRALRLQGGYSYRWDDRDQDTPQNEYVTHTVSLGLGLHQRGAHWGLDAGYALSWTRSDFGDPARSRGNSQRLLTRLLWTL